MWITSCLSKRCVRLSTVIISLLTLVTQWNFLYFFPNRFRPSKNYTSEYPHLAVIVDDRATHLLVNVVRNVLQHIPSDWKVQIFTLPEHWSFYEQSSLRPWMNTQRIFLTALEKRRSDMSPNEFINRLFTSASFWQQVQGDRILFFQIDSVLCSNSLSHLSDFLQYDFIGAPWATGGCCNGGLSLRDRRKTLQMLESGYVHYQSTRLNEDGWFTKYLPYFNGRVAPVSIAKRFAVETVYHPRPFAVHNPRVDTIGLENMARLCVECPEVRSITSYCSSIGNVSKAD